MWAFDQRLDEKLRFMSLERGARVGMTTTALKN